MEITEHITIKDKKHLNVYVKKKRVWEHHKCYDIYVCVGKGKWKHFHYDSR